MVVFVEQSQRRIPVQYAKRVVGRRTYGGSTTYLPIKINMANVIPVIFASSILMPTMIAGFGDQSLRMGSMDFGPPAYRRLALPRSVRVADRVLRLLLHVDHLQHGGNRGQHEALRWLHSGDSRWQATADYLKYVSSRITWVGATYLAIVALTPTIVFQSTGHHGWKLRRYVNHDSCGRWPADS